MSAVAENWASPLPIDDAEYQEFLKDVERSGRSSCGSQMRAAQLFRLAEDRGHIERVAWPYGAHLSNAGRSAIKWQEPGT